MIEMIEPAVDTQVVAVAQKTKPAEPTQVEQPGAESGMEEDGYAVDAAGTFKG